MRKSGFCICENKDADKLRGNRAADQRLYFRYIDSTKMARRCRNSRVRVSDQGPVVQSIVSLTTSLTV